MGEFGRTPLINAETGRDHFPAATPVVLGGVGIQTGQALGATNAAGTRPTGEPTRVADVAATILSQLGLPPGKPFTAAFDSPTDAHRSYRPRPRDCWPLSSSRYHLPSLFFTVAVTAVVINLGEPLRAALPIPHFDCLMAADGEQVAAVRESHIPHATLEFGQRFV